jgi:hypothetical protein
MIASAALMGYHAARSLGRPFLGGRMAFKKFFLFLIPLALILSCDVNSDNEVRLTVSNKTNQSNHPLYIDTLSGAITQGTMVAINNNNQRLFKGETAGTVSFTVTFDNVHYSGTTPISLVIGQAYLLTFEYNSSTTPPLTCKLADSSGGIHPGDALTVLP